MTSQPRDVDPLKQLENDYSDEISSIELVIENVKNKFVSFQKELSQKQSQILTELSNIQRRVFEIYNMKKKSLFDVYQNRDVLMEFNLSTHVSVAWKIDGLGLGDICEICYSKIPKSIPNPPTIEPYRELIKLLYKVRPSQSLLNSIDMEYPSEMTSTAKKLIPTIEYKYPILDMYEWIQHNLKNNRSISDIQDALYFISKYAICLFYDPSRTIFHTINTQTTYYTDNISSKVDYFNSIIRKMDFVFNPATRCYTINSLSLSTPPYIDKLAGICCELLLAFEELIYFREKINVDPISYFTRSSKLQSVCPITDPVDACASHRDASLTSLNSLHSSPSQSMNYRTGDTPNSSLTDTQFPSNCSAEMNQSHSYSTTKDSHESVSYRRGSDEIFKSQAFNKPRDFHEVNKPPPSPMQNEFVPNAFRGLEESNLYSIPDNINDEPAGNFRRNGRLTHSVMLPKGNTSFDLAYKPCPKCNKSNPISYNVCYWCTFYIH